MTTPVEPPPADRPVRLPDRRGFGMIIGGGICLVAGWGLFALIAYLVTAYGSAADQAGIDFLLMPLLPLGFVGLVLLIVGLARYVVQRAGA